MPKPSLAWLPEPTDFVTRIKALEAAGTVAWADLVALANQRLDFLKVERLDKLVRRHFGEAPPPGLPTKPVRLAILGSSTTVHLLAPIRVAALRRNIWLTLHEGEYGQYQQELADVDAELHRFRPDVVLLAFDSRHVTAGFDAASDAAAADAALDEQLGRMRQCWSLAREKLGAAVIQQTVMPTLPTLMGSNEQRLPGSPVRLIARINQALRSEADAAGVQLLALDDAAAQDGINEWHDPVLWHRAKQEVTPVAAPVYGDLVGRLVAALQGRSSKCLVLDLDNTLWGGVIGDDGLEGIAIGQGSALGEAFLSVQEYAKSLAKRGVILAVCSKNDEVNALSAFEKHPDMLLKRSDISSFFANWDDKATNLRRIAKDLNIGLDSLVFLDDNPFERNLVRGELPEVAVPEIPDDDPALMAKVLADAGYFEGLSITDEDRARTVQYQANRERAALESSATDLPAYLRSLEMQLVWRRFDRIGLSRIVQLINKTNQFNLTTRRKTEEQVSALMADPNSFGLQLRLLDRFGDNGIIAIVIGHVDEAKVCHIDTWLMSCRVLGRGVEEATLALIAQAAGELGAETLVGEYIPTAKNGMVSGHYGKLGFSDHVEQAHGGHVARLSLHDFVPAESYMAISEGA
ncbi:HAD-IIIC family phosphatase [Lichenicola sp.]|uniref:HAD-IIIC family phosphatase n=1 Tax=Lichenicola sp. TaxID=2804529 RepID=UPI003B008B74